MQHTSVSRNASRVLGIQLDTSAVKPAFASGDETLLHKCMSTLSLQRGRQYLREMFPQRVGTHNQTRARLLLRSQSTMLRLWHDVNKF